MIIGSSLGTFILIWDEDLGRSDEITFRCNGFGYLFNKTVEVIFQRDFKVFCGGGSS